MALMTPQRATVTVSSTYEVGGLSTATPVGHPLAVMAPGAATQVIDDLCIQMDNLEYRHGVLMRKMETMSDTEVANSIAIGEIHLRVTNVEERVQTLQTTLHGAELQNQQLRTRVAEMESREGTMMSNYVFLSVSTKDANQKFLRSLPASWSQVSLIMRTKPRVDTLSFDDIYNNIRVFEYDVKGSTASSSSTQDVAFVSSESTSNTNDVDEFDLEEMDLKWQVAMIFMRLNKFYKSTGRKLQFDAKELVGFDKTKEEPKALVTIDGDGVDWTSHAEDEQENFVLIAYNNSGSNTEGDQIYKGVLSYENEVLESVFDSRSSDLEDSPMYDRFVKVEGMLAVPPPMTGIYMPPKYDFGIDDVETLESVPKPAVNEPKAISKLKFGLMLLSLRSMSQTVMMNIVILTSKEQENLVLLLMIHKKTFKDKGYWLIGIVPRHMTGNKAYLVEYQDYNGGPVAFGGSKGQITSKGKIITGKLDFEDVYFVKELKQFNLFSVSQMCDKKNKVLFTDSECLVLSPDFKLPDENQVLLRVPRRNNNMLIVST
ncbi:hypothetical protein Tco_0341362 [Tanacetum coccineum]